MINNVKTREAISTDIIAEISQPILNRDRVNIFFDSVSWIYNKSLENNDVSVLSNKMMEFWIAELNYQ